MLIWIVLCISLAGSFPISCRYYFLNNSDPPRTITEHVSLVLLLLYYLHCFTLAGADSHFWEQRPVWILASNRFLLPFYFLAFCICFHHNLCYYLITYFLGFCTEFVNRPMMFSWKQNRRSWSCFLEYSISQLPNLDYGPHILW